MSPKRKAGAAGLPAEAGATAEEAAAAAEEAAAEEGLVLVRCTTNKSGYRGVLPSNSKSKPYKVEVWRDGKKANLGSFPTKEEACLACGSKPQTSRWRLRLPEEILHDLLVSVVFSPSFLITALSSFSIDARSKN